MNHRFFRTMCNAAIFYAALLPCTIWARAAQTAPPDPASQQRVLSAVAKLPLSFETNAGQTDSRVHFLTRGKNYTVFLTNNEAVIALRPPAKSGTQEGMTPANVTMKVLGADPAAKIAGVEPLPGVANYFLGNDPAKWRSGVATYAKVKYSQIYPGIDLVYYGHEGRLEYDLAVASGADPAQIRFAISGADQTFVEASTGELVLQTAAGEVRFRKPVLYQPGSMATVEGEFAVTGQVVRFRVGAYDRSLPLIIDPQLVYSTYLGGSDEDTAYSIALNANGDAFITGITCSVNFPVTSGAYQVHVDGPGGCSYFSNQSQDIFVTKLNAAGTALIYSTYIGGSNQDSPTQVAVDSAGNAYVGGFTISQDYPTTPGALQATCAPINTYNGPNCGYTGVMSSCPPSGSNSSGFVTKLNQAGTALVYSTFIGGTGSDSVTSLAIDSAGEAYVTGASTAYYGQAIFCPGSPQVSFTWPVTSNAYYSIAGKTNPPLDYNPFPVFSKFNADGTALLYSTVYASLTSGYGGLRAAHANQVVVDGSGKAHIAGSALYDTMPGTTGGYQPDNNASGVGGYNGWVAIFDPSQSGNASLVAATMLGGDGVAPAGQNGCYAGGDNAVGIAVDTSGNNYLTGTACSANFPTTAGAVIPTNQKNCPGNGETPYTGFAAKLNATLSSLTYSTFLGGTQCVDDYGAALAVNATGLAYITGNTSDSTFPQFNALSGSSLNGTQAPFIVELNSTATDFLFSSILGAFTPGANAGSNGIAVDAKGNIYVAGGVTANPGVTNFPITPGAFQQTPGGNGDGFASKVGPVKTYLTIKNTAPSSVATGTNLTYTITVANDGPDSAAGITLTDAIPAGTVFLEARSSDGSCTGPAVGKRGDVTCQTSSLAKDAGFEVHLVVRVVGKSGTTITDTAAVNSETSNPNSANNSATATTTVD